MPMHAEFTAKEQGNRICYACDVGTDRSCPSCATFRLPLFDRRIAPCTSSTVIISLLALTGTWLSVRGLMGWHSCCLQRLALIVEG